jgi:drug/metabolite transporter (DMT)-like permease
VSLDQSLVLRGVLVGISAQSVFSIHDTCAKWLTQSYSVFQVISMQAMVSGTLVALALILSGQAKRTAIRDPRGLALRGTLAATGALASFYAYTVLPLADVYAIIFCAPLMVTAVSAPLLGERVKGREWLAIAAGFCGVLIVINPAGQALSLGHGAALVCAFVSVAVTLLLRSSANQGSRFMLVGAVSVGHFLVGLPGLMLTARPPAASDLPVIILGGAAMAGAQFLMVQSLRMAPAALVAPAQYLKLVWGLVFGFLVFGDYPKVHMLAGAAIVILSALYLLGRSRAPQV